MEHFPPPVSEVTTREDVIGMSNDTVYYLDSEEGSDILGDGSEKKPWKSIEKVQPQLLPGDRVILSDGSYTFNEDYNNLNDRENHVIFMNKEGENPVIWNLKLSYGKFYYVNNRIIKAKIIFYGINFKTVDSDPGPLDPFDPNANQNSFNKSQPPVTINLASDISFIRCKIEGSSNKNLTAYAIRMRDVSGISFEACEVTRAQALVNFYGETRNLIFLNNYFHDMCRSCFLGNDGLTENIVIQGNHITGAEWYEGDEPYVPQGNNRYHGSAIAIRNGGYIIRNNVIHNGWNSSGISTYGNTRNIPEEGAYNNILIENNLIYDLRESTAAIRLYWIGENVVIRNNTIIGSINRGKTLCYYYNPAIVFYSLGYETSALINKKEDGAGIYLYNNICIGMVSFYESLWDSINEGNNVFWAVEKDHHANLKKEKFLDSGTTLSQSKIVVSYNSGQQDFFENGFFEELPDLRPYSEIGKGNHKVQTFMLDPSSIAVRWGAPEHQPNESLGLIGEDGFLIPTGNERSNIDPSVGCYQVRLP